MPRIGLAVLALIAVSAVSPQADECGPPDPIQVPAVCGHTLLLVGGKFDVPDGKPYAYAEAISRQRVELWRGEDKIAETESDDNGRFVLPPVAKGPYRLTVPYSEGMGITRPVIVTKNRAQRCDKPLFLYLGPAGWPCRGHASLVKPLELSPDTFHKPR